MAQAPDTSIKNPVKRDGVSQRQGRLAALDPGFVKVDERTTQDFLLFALEFSHQLKFYDENNDWNGDWEIFWGSSPSVVTASIERYNPLPLKTAFNSLQAASSPTGTHIMQMFGQILALARQLDDWLRSLSEAEPLGRHIKTLIGANLATSLPRLLAFEKGAIALIGSGTGDDTGDYSGFSPVWNLQHPDLVKADTSLFNPLNLLDEDEIPEGLPPEPTLEERFASAAKGLHRLFTGIYNIFFQVINAAPNFFQATLERSEHPPHITLFITFLKLYRLVQDDLNRMTQLHLDFYYKEVLQLKKKDAIPDKVHLFFELAKQVEEHQLKKNIRFKAGKDSKSKELIYTLDQDVVLNRAQVESLRTVYTDRREERIRSVHASPIANSSDGKGAKFPKTEEKPSWPTLGDELQDQATCGFAIAGRELLLAEGIRTVTLEITVDVNPTDGFDLSKDMLAVSLSGEKAWIDVKEAADTFTAFWTEKIISLSFTLPADAPAVVAMDAKALKTNYGTDLPVLRVLLKQFDADGNPNWIYDDLRKAEIQNLDLTVNVEGVANMLVFNDDGPVDPSKPFMPFGPTPKVGSAFYVGSAEAALKSLDKFTLHVTWQQLPLNFQDYYAGYKDLPADFGLNSFSVNAHSISAAGINGPATDVPLFDQEEGEDPPSEEFNNLKTIIGLTEAGGGFNLEMEYLLQPDQLAVFGQNSKEGFFRFDLNRDFEHDQYPTTLTRQMLAASKLPRTVVGAWYWETQSDGTKIPVQEEASVIDNDLEIVIPNAPHTPVIKAMSLDYKAKTYFHFEEDSSLFFFHIHPFADTYEPLKAEKEKKSVVPQFNDEGTLYIGLRDLEPLQSLQLLIQVAENTAEADLEPAEINWAFLADNDWVDFDPADIPSDTTQGLITSGIVMLSIPAEINKNNTVLSPDLHWIKASAAINAKAVSETINIHTQAARVTFQDQENADDHLQKPLIAKSISKLREADSAVKKITQEYESFGGRPKEGDLSFYTRISEHLRHKGRAITQFDYERLILEAFAYIFKVKCVNHTNNEFQLRPGHVLVSVIPDFTKLKAVDRRQPKVTRANLKAIREYLEKRNTAFVSNGRSSLHVMNPVYEKIQVSFNVQFKPDITAKAFHRRQLQEAIIRYLSPWAYEGGEEINFGGKVYKSSILDFVEDQDYVDFVTDFRMEHTHFGPSGNGENLIEKDISFAEARTPVSILVPMDEMSICILDEEDCTISCPEAGITEETLGYMVIDGESFAVKKT
jgi:hypothetical protein